MIRRLAIGEGKLFCSYSNSIILNIFDINLKLIKETQLRAKSHDNDTYIKGIVVNRDYIITLFSSNQDYHCDPIQMLQLDGTLIRSMYQEMQSSSLPVFV